jgi:VanZ family protein
MRTTSRLQLPQHDETAPVWLAFAPALLYGMLLTYLVLAPSPWWFLGATGASVEESVDRALADWIQHGTAYAILTGLLLAATALARKPWTVACLAVALGHGMLTEWLQGFIPRRCCCWPDLAANAAGVGIGAACLLLVLTAGRRFPQTQPAAVDQS